MFIDCGVEGMACQRVWDLGGLVSAMPPLGTSLISSHRSIKHIRLSDYSFGRRRFSVAGPSTWNSLPDSLRDPELGLDTFKRQLKTYIYDGKMY